MISLRQRRRINEATPATGFRRWRHHLYMPLSLSVVCLALYGWIANQHLDSIEQRSLNSAEVLKLLEQQVLITVVATVLVVAVAVPLGILLTRAFARRLTTPIISVVNIGQAVPSIGVLVLIAIFFGLGFWPAVIAFALYTILPVLRNTMVGLEQIDPAYIEAARGMGLSPAAVLFRIELPLAVPVMLAGIRTALVILVGTATLATFVGAGGLGQLIVTGNNLGRTPVLLTGSILSAVLALFVDWIAGIAEAWLRPRGL